jgi:hypothetical protein
VSFSKPCELDSTTASASASAYRTDTPLLGLGSPFQRVKLPPSDSHMSTYPQRSYACDRLFGLSGLSATPLHPQPQPRIPIHAPQTQAHDFLAHDMHFSAFFFHFSTFHSQAPSLIIDKSAWRSGKSWNIALGYPYDIVTSGSVWFGLACFGSVTVTVFSYLVGYDTHGKRTCHGQSVVYRLKRHEKNYNYAP